MLGGKGSLSRSALGELVDQLDPEVSGSFLHAPNLAIAQTLLKSSFPGRIRCKHCRTGTVHLCMKPGRTMCHRNLQVLALPSDLLIPACIRCNTTVLDAELRARLAPLLADAYRRDLQQRIRYVIDTLAQHISQRRLERLMNQRTQRPFTSRRRSDPLLLKAILGEHKTMPKNCRVSGIYQEGKKFRVVFYWPERSCVWCQTRE